MNPKKIAMRCFALMAFLAFWFVGFAQVPVGFPVMQHTNNAEADAENYEQAKIAYYNQHPELQSAEKTEKAEIEKATAKSAKMENPSREVVLSQEELDRVANKAAVQKEQLLKDFAANKAQWYNENRALYDAYVNCIQALKDASQIELTSTIGATAAQQSILRSYPQLFKINHSQN